MLSVIGLVHALAYNKNVNVGPEHSASVVGKDIHLKLQVEMDIIIWVNCNPMYYKFCSP